MGHGMWDRGWWMRRERGIGSKGKGTETGTGQGREGEGRGEERWRIGQGTKAASGTREARTTHKLE